MSSLTATEMPNSYCPNSRGECLRGLAVIVVQQTAETWPTLGGAGGPVVVARRRGWPDELTTQRLVEALAMMVGTELAEHVPKVPPTEDHEVTEALGPGRETFVSSETWPSR